MEGLGALYSALLGNAEPKLIYEVVEAAKTLELDELAVQGIVKSVKIKLIVA